MTLELSSSTVEPLSAQRCHERDVVLQQELDDRSFDVGDDDDLDLGLAHSSTAHRGSSGDHGSEDGQDEASFIAQADQVIDAFSDEESEQMIEELKEIGMFKFLQKYVQELDIALPRLLHVFDIIVPTSGEPIDHLYLLRLLKIAISRTLRNRFPLADYSTPDDAVSAIRSAKKILVLTGAGISTNCGIPDFRSPTGIYARLQASGQYPELTDPQEMFDMSIFLENPEIFYSFANELYPNESVRRASRAHLWIKQLEDQGKLCRNYTQNIDTIEKMVKIEKVLHAHGSFATCSCVKCRAQFPGDSIREAIFAQTVPLCPLCTSTLENRSSSPSRKRARLNGSNGVLDADEDESEHYVNPWKDKPILKPDITFFGQALDNAFDRCLLADREEVDLLIVMGTSLQVAPVNEILSHIPHRVPQILINRDPVPHVMDKVDIVLLGDCDEVVDWLAKRLEDNSDPAKSEDRAGPEALENLGQPLLALEGIDHIWSFPCANREHPWMERAREALQHLGSHEGGEAEGEIASAAEYQTQQMPAADIESRKIDAVHELAIAT